MSRSGCATLTIFLLLTSCAQPFGPRAPSMNDALSLKADQADLQKNSGAIRQSVWKELNIGNDDTNTSDKIVKPSDYTAAGYNYVYRQCSNYFDSLILYQNKVGYASDLTVAGGTSLGAILGIAKSSAAAISGVAAGVGFASAALTAFQNRALITPYPNETKTLILSALDTYRAKNAPDAMTTPAEAITNVQHFAELCTYSGITRAAKQALSQYKAGVDTPNPQPGAPAASQDPISSALSLNTPLDDAQQVALYWFVFRGGNPCAPQASCDAVKKAVPDLASTIYKAGAYVDPQDIKAKVGNNLAMLYSENASFRTAVDHFPPSAASASTKTFDFSKALGAKNVEALSERFGTFVFPQQSPEPSQKP